MSAARIKRARELAGLSLLQASLYLGIQRPELEAYEDGWRSPDGSVWRKIADVYGVTVPWLQGAEPYIPPHLSQLLYESELRITDQERILEIIGSMHTKETSCRD